MPLAVPPCFPGTAAGALNWHGPKGGDAILPITVEGSVRAYCPPGRGSVCSSRVSFGGTTGRYHSNTGSLHRSGPPTPPLHSLYRSNLLPGL
jgi:hypothetical protein